MEQRNDDLRERLLSRLPQAENLAGYREETGALLAKHERAVRADYRATNVLVVCSLGIFFMLNKVWDSWRSMNPQALHMLAFVAGMILLAAVVSDIRYRIYKSQVATLKEIKQVQLQILELQVSLQSERSPRT